jgi:hypothetical protein
VSVAGSVSAGLQAALLLARGRPDGLRFVEEDLAGAGRSFWAAAVCLPAFVCLRLLAWTESGAPPASAHAFAIDLLFYVIGWVGYVVLSRPVVEALGRANRWPRYIAAWNWCNVIQYFLLVAAAIPELLGVPGWFGQTCQLVALGWALWLEWFAARIALEVPGPAAAGLVGLDVALGLLLAAFTGPTGAS